MVITCFTFVRVETNASLYSTSNNRNSLDGNSSMKSIEGKLKIVTKF
jgi:hypothetical protein